MTAQLRRSIGAAKHRYEKIEQRKVDVEERMKHNVSRLQQVEGQMTALGGGSCMAEVGIVYMCLSTGCVLGQLCRLQTMFVALFII